MRFFCGIAGIPHEISSDVITSSKSFLPGNVTAFSKPLRGTEVSTSYLSYFSKKFEQAIIEDKSHDLRDTGFFVVFVSSSAQEVCKFRHHLFPSIPVIQLQWHPQMHSTQAQRTSKNELIALLRAKIIETCASISAIKKEFDERLRKTPLLLPIKNFHSNELRPLISALYDQIPFPSENPQQSLSISIQGIERSIPRTAIDKKSFYVDERGVHFFAPGTNDMHGVARPSTDHPELCLLAGRRRFGAPYNPSFHFDCTHPPKSKLKGAFFMCHGNMPSELTGTPHLNISPNDHVR